MIKDIRAISRAKMGFFKDKKGFLDTSHIISVSCGDHTPLFETKTEKVLPLEFDDVGANDVANYKAFGKTIKFSEDQAKSVIEFLESIKEPTNLYINCYLGVSRSGAIATFSREFFSFDYQTFKEHNPQIVPNTFVLGVLDKVYKEHKAKKEEKTE